MTVESSDTEGKVALLIAGRDEGPRIDSHLTETEARQIAGGLLSKCGAAAPVSLRAALERIVLHADMPDGETWPTAYSEVVEIARNALASEQSA